MAPSMAGRLLVATPLIDEPIFGRTVVLLLAHGDAGALGVVLNRPSDLVAVDLLPDWGRRAAEPAVMFTGGPVETNSVIGLHPHGTVDLNAEPDDLPGAPEQIRLFAGSAGWAPGQLEGEIGEGAWWVLEADVGDAFTAEPLTLWSRVLRRQRPPVSWFAVHPPDPMVN